jgi:hypothetical protein
MENCGWLRGLWPVLILLPFHRLFMLRCLLFLALIFDFLPTFISHRVILSYEPSVTHAKLAVARSQRMRRVRSIVSSAQPYHQPQYNRNQRCHNQHGADAELQS